MEVPTSTALFPDVDQYRIGIHSLESPAAAEEALDGIDDVTNQEEISSASASSALRLRHDPHRGIRLIGTGGTHFLTSSNARSAIITRHTWAST